MILDLEKTEDNLHNAKQELEKSVSKEKEISEKISEGKADLHEIKMQQSQAQKELEEITSKIYNSKQELGSSGNTGVLTNTEKEFIEKEIAKKPETKSIIEAASVVAASLKSKLNKTEKELEVIQQLLEKERKEHELTKKKLEKLLESNSKDSS